MDFSPTNIYISSEKWKRKCEIIRCLYNFFLYLRYNFSK